LVTAPDDDDHLSEDELLSTVALIFGAGFVTTTNLIGNGLLALLRHPGEAARLWEDPGLAPIAVEEMLRFDSPVQLNGRYVFEPIEVGGRADQVGEEERDDTGREILGRSGCRWSAGVGRSEFPSAMMWNITRLPEPGGRAPTSSNVSATCRPTGPGTRSGRRW